MASRLAAAAAAAAAASSSTSSCHLARIISRRGLAGGAEATGGATPNPTEQPNPATPAAGKGSGGGPMASVRDHPRYEKVNLWEDPMSPMKWKHGHFVIAAVSIWGAFTYGGFKLFYEKKEIKTEVMAPSKK